MDENRWYNSICRFGSAVILATVFGQRAKSFNHPRVQDFFRMQERFMHVVRLGATPPVDAFPILKYIPGWIVGGPWKEEARAVNRLQRELYDELIKDTRQRMESGLGINSFMAKVIDKNDGGETEMTPDQLAYIGGNLVSSCISSLRFWKEHKAYLICCQESFIPLLMMACLRWKEAQRRRHLPFSLLSSPWSNIREPCRNVRRKLIQCVA